MARMGRGEGTKAATGREARASELVRLLLPYWNLKYIQAISCGKGKETPGEDTYQSCRGEREREREIFYGGSRARVAGTHKLRASGAHFRALYSTRHENPRKGNVKPAERFTERKPAEAVAR